MTKPDFREMDALRALCLGGEEYGAQLGRAGTVTIQNMISKGWVVEAPESLGLKRYRITMLGSAIFDDASRSAGARSSKKASKITMIKPLIATLDTRTVKPLK
ncbi:hypothetical protein [Methylobacterium sp. J-068]|uniref:hypothetical protein n=1 Tax=Methylobacterium sp. J-068 TaxID=2836649 RepID=UPI001FBA8B8C|nr:hypothetical protein [Methylobacterium sp. J-068]MCJ2033170.1 hypothetical protein [Methylobacterium sp. J-068]